jgi:hypothetical protein
MNPLMRWIDQKVHDLCEWLHDTLSGRHGLSTVGYELAGLGGLIPLPTDRRTRPDVLMMSASESPQRNRNSPKDTGVYTPDTSCKFWAYCHMNGTPCIHCGGRNSIAPNIDYELTHLCPPGKTVGVAWFGCCTDSSGYARDIGFWDCCGSGYCSLDPKKVCANWPAAKSWCNVTGKSDRTGPMSYYCTVVMDNGPCS